MTLHNEPTGPILPRATGAVPSRVAQLPQNHGSITRKMALAVALALSPAAATACSGADFTVADPQDQDAGSDAPVETSTEAGKDAQNDAPADSTSDAEAGAEAGPEAGLDAGPDSDAGTSCSKSGTVVFDPSMGCYKEGIVRGGSFLPSPESSEDTAVCQSGMCANSPVSGTDTEVLWVQEGLNTGKFSSVKNPAAFSARCSTYTSLTPPSLTQIKAEVGLPTGWFVPGVSKVGTDYKLTDASNCPGKSVLYVMPY